MKASSPAQLLRARLATGRVAPRLPSAAPWYVVEEVFARLFGVRDTRASHLDPEVGRILRTPVFGDVFAIGELDDRTRELVTVTVLATIQALPQLKAHAAAALHVGVTPVELREAVYQLATLIGFPCAVNAIRLLGEHLREQERGQEREQE